MSMSPFLIADKEIERALEIVLNYFNTQQGFVSLSFAKDALVEVYRQRQFEATRALVLANRSIAALEKRTAKSSQAA